MSARDPQEQRHGDPVLAPEYGREVLAVDERHRDVLDAADLAEVMNPDDVLVGDLPGEQQLALESPFDFSRGLRLGHHFRPDHFDGDRDAKVGVPRLIDRAHAADAERANDVVPGSERLPRLQGPGVARVRRHPRGPDRRGAVHANGRGIAEEQSSPIAGGHAMRTLARAGKLDAAARANH
jgi:hypothetical protein